MSSQDRNAALETILAGLRNDPLCVLPADASTDLLGVVVAQYLNYLGSDILAVAEHALVTSGLHGTASQVAALRRQVERGDAEHRIVSLPGSVHDFTGDPLPGYGGALITPPARYPLHALCSECHEPVRCETAESGWEHA
jgi:hypothetical protein